MAVFELKPEQDHASPFDSYEEGRAPNAVLLHNAQWFIRVRWLVILIFTLAGLISTWHPAVVKLFGLQILQPWPLYLAGSLFAANCLFSILIGNLDEKTTSNNVLGHIWLQIFVDLLVVSVLVHLVGSTVTFVSFTYLFHIALSCIFLSPQGSFRVTLLASLLYLGVVAGECLGLLSETSVLSITPTQAGQSVQFRLLLAASAVLSWFIVWFLVSTLSRGIRERDRQLHTANEKLIRADEEKNKLVQRTTHDLKAPFAGIETNIQRVRYLFWNDITDEHREILRLIETRSKTLRERISAILLLGNLRSDAIRGDVHEKVAVRPLIDHAIAEVHEKAAARRISYCLRGPDSEVVSNGKQLEILLRNLIANAVFYSKEDDIVEILTEQSEDTVCVSIRDQGIGIDEQALPHIFDEYYRTQEAMQFNKSSSGLGLAIVKEIVRNLDLRIEVTSKPGEGTAFEVRIPRNKEYQAQTESNTNQEADKGIA